MVELAKVDVNEMAMRGRAAMGRMEEESGPGRMILERGVMEKGLAGR